MHFLENFIDISICLFVSLPPSPFLDDLFVVAILASSAYKIWWETQPQGWKQMGRPILPHVVKSSNIGASNNFKTLLAMGLTKQKGVRCAIATFPFLAEFFFFFSWFSPVEIKGTEFSHAMCRLEQPQVAVLTSITCWYKANLGHNDTIGLSKTISFSGILCFHHQLPFCWAFPISDCYCQFNSEYLRGQQFLSSNLSAFFHHG